MKMESYILSIVMQKRVSPNITNLSARWDTRLFVAHSKRKQGPGQHVYEYLYGVLLGKIFLAFGLKYERSSGLNPSGKYLDSSQHR